MLKPPTIASVINSKPPRLLRLLLMLLRLLSSTVLVPSPTLTPKIRLVPSLTPSMTLLMLRALASVPPWIQL